MPKRKRNALFRWIGVFLFDKPLESSRGSCPPRPSQNRTWCVTPSGSQSGAFTHVMRVKQANRGVMISSAQCRHMFPSPVIPNRYPLAPSALPDFTATMDTSDFHQPIPSPSLFTLVRKLLFPKANWWISRVTVKTYCEARRGLRLRVGDCALTISRTSLLPAGPLIPSARSNDGLFGAQYLHGQHHLLPLHLASFPVYASTAMLPRQLQDWIPSPWLVVTRAGFAPACFYGLARPQLMGDPFIVSLFAPFRLV